MARFPTVELKSVNAIDWSVVEHVVICPLRVRPATSPIALRDYPERNRLFSGCHGHAFASPCFGRGEDTATQSRDRGTHNLTHDPVTANPYSRTTPESSYRARGRGTVVRIARCIRHESRELLDRAGRGAALLSDERARRFTHATRFSLIE